MIVFPRGEVKPWSDLTPGAPFLSIAGLSKLRPIGNVTRPSASGLAARADRGLRIWLDEGQAGSAEGHSPILHTPTSPFREQSARSKVEQVTGSDDTVLDVVFALTTPSLMMFPLS